MDSIDTVWGEFQALYGKLLIQFLEVCICVDLISPSDWRIISEAEHRAVKSKLAEGTVGNVDLTLVLHNDSNLSGFWRLFTSKLHSYTSCISIVSSAFSLVLKHTELLEVKINTRGEPFDFLLPAIHL